jgi:thermostable 8-oxoguanine DNA glycosylase
MRQGSSNKYMPMPLKESKRGLFIFKWLIKNLRLKSKRKNIKQDSLVKLIQNISSKKSEAYISKINYENLAIYNRHFLKILK